MSSLSLFLKKNKKVKSNTKYAATKSLCNEDGSPLEWEIKPLTTSETENIREACTTEVQVTGKPGMYRAKTDSSAYIAKLICASVVEPDLYNKELQDSYDVRTPEDLLRELVDDPVEYNAFAMFVQNFNGMDETMDDKVAAAKN